VTHGRRECQPIAFSSEVNTGSRQENAAKQSTAWFWFNQNLWALMKRANYPEIDRRSSPVFLFVGDFPSARVDKPPPRPNLELF
jgi:hypothetical protein